MEMDTKESVELYRSLGLLPFPVCKPLGLNTCRQHGRCQSPGKVPLLKAWNNLERNERCLKGTYEWFTKNDWDTNVGLLCGNRGGLVVLDVDGPEGRFALTEENDMGDLGEYGACVRTGRIGGYHYWYSPLGDRPVSTKHGFIKSVDLVGDGGFVLAPPSVHKSGNVYTFEGDEFHSLLLDHCTLPTVPEWLVDLSEVYSPKVSAPAPDQSQVGLGNRCLTFLEQGAKENQREEAVNAVVNMWGHFETEDIIDKVSHALIDLSPQLDPQWPWSEDDVVKMVRSFERQGGPNPARALQENPTLILDTANPPKKEEESQKVPKTKSIWGFIDEADEIQERTLVEGMFNQGQFVMLAAKPGAGKTLVALDWGMHIASGTDYSGREVSQGTVILFEKDASNQLDLYLPLVFQSGRYSRDKMGERFQVSTDQDNDLSTEVGYRQMIRTCDEFDDLKLVVLDSLTDFISLKKFNAEEWAWLRQFKESMANRGVTVLVLNHAKMNADQPNLVTKEPPPLQDRIYGGVQTTKQFDQIIYMKGSLSDGYVILDFSAKNRGAEKANLRVSFFEDDGFIVSPIFNPNTFRWSKAEIKIVEAITRGSRSISHLLETTGLSERAIRKCIPRLVSFEILTKEDNGPGRGKESVYRLGRNADNMKGGQSLYINR